MKQKLKFQFNDYLHSQFYNYFNYSKFVLNQKYITTIITYTFNKYITT